MLYQTVGISKQAVIQYAKRQQVFDKKLIVLIKEAEFLRREHPGCGVEKMYYTLSPDFIGRDRFIDLFMDLGFRLKVNKNYRRTTNSVRSSYQNLIHGMLVFSPNQIWQSDITYIRIGDRFCYAVFIIDIYTKKVVGYQVSEHMRATANVSSLSRAIKLNGPPLIHHSDRGGQYIYKAYTNLLRSHNCYISMCDNAMDNAYAERINQTIKNEYLKLWKPQSFKQLKTMTTKAIKNYNQKRLHNHLDRKTPIAFEQEVLNLPMHERPKVIVYTDGQAKMERASNPSPFVAREDLQAPNCPI